MDTPLSLYRELTESLGLRLFVTSIVCNNVTSVWLPCILLHNDVCIGVYPLLPSHFVCVGCSSTVTVLLMDHVVLLQDTGCIIVSAFLACYNVIDNLTI